MTYRENSPERPWGCRKTQRMQLEATFPVLRSLCNSNTLKASGLPSGRFLHGRIVQYLRKGLGEKDRDLRKVRLLFPDHEAERGAGELVGLTQLIL